MMRMTERGDLTGQGKGDQELAAAGKGGELIHCSV